MYKNLSRRVQRILYNDAPVEARRFNSGQIQPEHLIIAILKEGGGIACQALRVLHINIMEFRRSLENAIPYGGSIISGDIPFSKRSSELLEKASKERLNMGNDSIGTEHLMFAALQESDSIVQLYLKERSVDADMLRVVVQTTFNRPRNPSEGGEFLDRGEWVSVYPINEYQPRRNNEKREGETPVEFPGMRKAPHISRIKAAVYPTLTPTLDEFSRDLTAIARSGKQDPVVGRKREIARALRILARRTKNNPVLIGEPGVGKTAIVEGIVQLFAQEDIPEALAGKRILSLDIGLVVAGTKYRGEFEERIKKMLREIQQTGNIILFIDEIHTIIGAGGAEGTMDASNMLKPVLSRGEIQCIGATTLQEYRKHFEKDGALERRFQAILVEEPDLEETVEILMGIKYRYEEHHNVHYTEEAVRSAAKLAERYLTGRFMPDKAIDLLDEAGAMRKLDQGRAPPDLCNIEADIAEMIERKGLLVSAQDYEHAAQLRDQVRKLRSRLDSVRIVWEQAAKKDKALVDEGDIRNVLAEITGIPLTHLEEQESKRLLRMEEELHKALVGQDDAVNRIASAIRRSRVGISSPHRPLGSFIFLGPTGVGKTLLAKRLSSYLFNTDDALIRIDMSDFMEKHNTSRLVGAPPGYIGYEEGGSLTEQIRRNPYRVILFDEIEKAHHDFFNLLLQVLEEGELKDNLGHTVSFRNTVIVMTSNAGIREISRDSRLGFGAGSGIMNQKEIETMALSELRRIFNPEFINRLDDVVVFHPLTMKQVEYILDLELRELSSRLTEQGYHFRILPAAKKVLIEKGWDPKYGARPMRRAIQKEVEDSLSKLILEGDYPPGTVFIASALKGRLSFKPLPPSALDENAVMEDYKKTVFGESDSRNPS
ncbi:MAG: ATP-dependent Clp protease ATP-binding subunit [Treponema sp.]|nr:ATP-dependent Clp protease ATP-binding subunit [Treponema sp.]